jgi:hypothetical protein
VPVVFLITIAAVLVGIFFAATGRGGEMAYEHADHAPLDLGPVSAADIALLRPPTAMWGYNMQVTDEALDRIARAMRERDVTIAYLQEQLATAARNGSYTEPGAAYAQLADESPLAPEIPFFPGAGEISQATDAPESHEPPVAAEVDEYPEPPASPQLYPEPPASPQFPEAPASPQSPETADIAEAPLVPRTADTTDAPKPLQTPLILKASPTKASPAPDPHDATQPSEILRDPEDDEATQPSETLPPHEPHGPQGPQGAFDTHNWWAEQEKAAREEAARRAAANPSGAAEDDSLAAAEEQGW